MCLPPHRESLESLLGATAEEEEMINATRSLWNCLESESQRLWAAMSPVLRPLQHDLVGQVIMLLCESSCWAVKRQAVSFLQALGRDGSLGDENTLKLQRLLYHPDRMVQLLLARILEHVPLVCARWKQIISDRNMAKIVVQHSGLALEFVESEFQEDREIVSAAVLQTGEALQFAPNLCGDEEIVLAAVMNTGSAVRFADEQLVEKNPRLQMLKDERGLGLWGNYVVLEEIGKGVGGSVWRAKGCSSQQMVAIKKMHTDQEWQEQELLLREIALLQSLKHQNIVQLKDVLILGCQDVRPVFELLKCDLSEVLKDLKRNGQMMCMDDVRRYSLDLLEGLYACHARGLMHRDLKPQNLLLSHEGSLKIADFRLARENVVHNRSYSLDVVTLWYRAPELILGARQYSCEIDCWSAACVMAEMATNCPLFPGDSEVDTLFKIFRLLGSPSDTHWPGGMALRHWRGRYPKWEDTGLKPLFDRRPELQERVHGDGGDLLVP